MIYIFGPILVCVLGYGATIVYLSICADWSVRQWFADLADWLHRLDLEVFPTLAQPDEHNASSRRLLGTLSQASPAHRSSRCSNLSLLRLVDLIERNNSQHKAKMKKSSLPSSGSLFNPTAPDVSVPPEVVSVDWPNPWRSSDTHSSETSSSGGGT